MDRLEQLIEEYQDDLTFEFRSDMPDSLSGLIIEDHVLINSDIDRDQAYITIAEEIGHYETSSNKNILDYSKNRKEENQARRWSYKKILPVHYLNDYKDVEEKVYLYQLAEEFNLPEEVVYNTIEMYKQQGEL